MNRPKTIFCDIDGTLIKHEGVITDQAKLEEIELLPNALEAINNWDKNGYYIILTTGRKESLRKHTEKLLRKIGIVYDQLIMGIGGGNRILINDRKSNGSYNTAYCVNIVRNEGIQHYDFNQKFLTISDKQPTHVNKPWGKEELIEYNDNYVVKKLFMKAGECCSLQYHKLKRETICVLSGKLYLHIGKIGELVEKKILKPGDTITIEPYIIHRMEGIEDSVYLETSTNELWDVVRLEDKYKRENTKESDYL